MLGTDVPVLVKKLFGAVQPTSAPTSIPQALIGAAKVWGISNPSTTPTPPANIVANALELVLGGFTSSDLKAVISGAVSDTTSHCKSTILIFSRVRHSTLLIT